MHSYCAALSVLFPGLPHSHILVILAPEDKPVTAEDVDSIVSAELPDPEASEQARQLHELVLGSMVHHECGPAHPAAACMKDGRCSKGFPKAYAERTEWREDLPYPVLRRRSPADGGMQVRHRGRLIGNQWVVPYSPFLSLRYGCHLNVEVCCSVKSVKYLFMYVYKGHDRQMVRADDLIRGGGDEIAEYQDLRSIGASEACWRILGMKMGTRSPAVVPLCVHLEDDQMVYFRPGQERQAAAAAPRTHLTAWLEYNRESAAADPGCRDLLYPNFPRHYAWHSGNKKWAKRRNRQTNVTIGRVVSMSPQHGDVYYLRVLLHQVTGATTFAELRTVEGYVCETYREACQRRGLLQDDAEWDVALRDAVEARLPAQIRQLYVTILLFCAPAEPLRLLQGVQQAMSEDLMLQHPALEPGMIETLVLLDLERRLQHAGKELRSYNLPAVSQEDRALAAELEHAAELRRLPPVLQEELAYDLPQLRALAAEQLPTLLPSQRQLSDTVLQAVRRRAPLAVFVDAPGGTGKTYTLNAILTTVRAEGLVALAVAHSGIAATLLQNGRTFHSRFKAPLSPDPTSTCAISAQSPLAELIRRTALIVWDEAPMSHRYLLEALDRTLQDITGDPEPHRWEGDRPGGRFSTDPARCQVTHHQHVIVLCLVSCSSTDLPI